MAGPTKPAEVAGLRLSGGSKLQPDNSCEYKSDADQPSSAGRLSKQYNSQNHVADRSHSDPNTIGSADRKPFHCDAKQTKASYHRQNRPNTRPQPGEAFCIFQADGPPHLKEPATMRIAPFIRFSFLARTAYGVYLDHVESNPSPIRTLLGGRQLRDFCAKQDWQIGAEYVDERSGKNGDRPQFQRMLDAAARREFDVLLFWSLDRLTREGACSPQIFGTADRLQSQIPELHRRLSGQRRTI